MILCRVWGYIYDLSSCPLEGAKVIAQVNTIPLRYLTKIVDPSSKTALTSENGYWMLDLMPNINFTPAGTKYIFDLLDPDGNFLQRLETSVPNRSTWELTW